MIIRKATNADLQTLQTLTAALYEDLRKYDPLLTTDFVYKNDGAYIKKHLDKDVYWIAENQSSPQGYALTKIVDEEEIPYKQAELYHLYVRESARGKGIGTLLINKFIEWSKQIGAISCYIAAFAANPAVEFYKSQGFAVLDAGLEMKIRPKNII